MFVTERKRGFALRCWIRRDAAVWSALDSCVSHRLRETRYGESVLGGLERPAVFGRAVFDQLLG